MVAVRVPRPVLVALLVTTSVLAAGCSGEDDQRSYVALGDSFTAGPLIPPVADAGCQRSSSNYPSLLAEAQDLDLVDVSCTGADTSDLIDPQQLADDATAPPQLDALADDTDLVTISIGANDGAIATAVLVVCSQLGADDPDGTPCQDAEQDLPSTVSELIDAMGEHLDLAYAAVQERAPDAEVLVVGYPQVVPAQGTCRDRLPIAEADYPWARDLNEQLDRTIRERAEAAGLTFVDVWAASEGHDICSDDPWVNGQTTDPDAALAFHPFASYEQAVADLVADAL